VQSNAPSATIKIKAKTEFGPSFMVNKPSNNGAAANSHRPFSFDRAMKFEHHHCSQHQSPVAVPELER